MCDLVVIGGFIAGAEGSIIAASVLVGAAIITSSNFWTSGGSPALLIAAGVLVGVAAGTLGYAISQLYSCLGTSSACDQLINALLIALFALLASLGPLVVAIGIGAGASVVPFVGSAVALGLLIAVGVQIAAFNTVTGLYQHVVTACKGAPSGATDVVQNILIWLGVGVALAGAALGGGAGRGTGTGPQPI
jgi:hypothetical protein